MNYFVTAIHTDSGKTIASAILCEALEADYWKPVQAGPPSDSATVKNLVSNPDIIIHRETYFLKNAMSPHAAAHLENIDISLEDFKLPQTNGNLIIEGAGGCLVPLNKNDFVIDLISYLNTPVIVVANLYLGSINHTLLTLEALHHRDIRIEGIIFNGHSNMESEQIIIKHAQCDCLLRIGHEPIINRGTIQQYAAKLKKKWNE